MNNNWGYNEADHNFKSSKELIHLLVDVVSKGGNLLLNVGPTAEGEIPPTSVQRLKDIGKWMKVNGDAIYGTDASPFRAVSWGRVTQKPAKGGTDLFLHVFDWPANGKLTVEGLGNEVVSAEVLGGKKATYQREGGNVVLQIPSSPVFAEATVVRLRIKGKPIVYEAPILRADANIFVKEGLVRVDQGSKGLETRFTVDGTTPSMRSTLYTKPIRVSGEKVTVKAANFHQGKLISGVSTVTLTRVLPLPAQDKSKLSPGVSVEVFKGDFDTIAQMLATPPAPAKSDTAIALGAMATTEHVGARFRGVLKVPADDVYVFDLLSDDGSRLLIDGQTVVDHDGLHGPTSKLGQIALSRGMHRIEVLWFNKTGGTALEISMMGTGQKATKITAEDLWHGE
jgi:alpha-L-fucosidase